MTDFGAQTAVTMTATTLSEQESLDPGAATWVVAQLATAMGLGTTQGQPLPPPPVNPLPPPPVNPQGTLDPTVTVGGTQPGGQPGPPYGGQGVPPQGPQPPATVGATPPSVPPPFAPGGQPPVGPPPTAPGGTGGTGASGRGPVLAIALGAVGVVIIIIIVAFLVFGGSSNSAQSTAASAVSALQTGDYNKLCGLVVPASQATCANDVKKAAELHVAFPNLRLGVVTVTGTTATAMLTCTGATYCSDFTGMSNEAHLVQVNGTWYIASNGLVNPNTNSNPNTNTNTNKRSNTNTNTNTNKRSNTNTNTNTNTNKRSNTNTNTNTNANASSKPSVGNRSVLHDVADVTQSGSNIWFYPATGATAVVS